jgi:hypothetical protein
MLPSTLWNALFRLRLSSHNLRIETGRYSQYRIQRYQRYCTICNGGDIIEDEYHFIIKCKSYMHLRQLYIKPYFYKITSAYHFNELNKSKHVGAINELGKFVYEALKLRQTLK